MTTASLSPGTPVAYVAPDGITYPARVLSLLSLGHVRVEVPELHQDHCVHERWLSDLTPREQARLREVGQ
jgi:hypothetical protein